MSDRKYIGVDHGTGPDYTAKITVESTPLESRSAFERVWNSPSQIRASEIRSEIREYTWQLRAVADHLDRKSGEIVSTLCAMNPTEASDALPDLDADVEALGDKVNEIVSQGLGFGSEIKGSDPDQAEKGVDGPQTCDPLGAESAYANAAICRGLGVPESMVSGPTTYSTVSRTIEQEVADIEEWNARLRDIMRKWREGLERERAVCAFLLSGSKSDLEIMDSMFPTEPLPSSGQLHYLSDDEE